MPINRRRVLHAAASASALKLLPASLAAAAFGSTARAATWPKQAFDATTMDDAVRQLFDGKAPPASDRVQLTAPDIAENGSVVPVTVTTTLPDVRSVTLLAEGNPRALIAQHRFGPRSAAPVSVRVRLGKTQNVVAVVGTADGSFHAASRNVKVTLGGCGG